MASSRKLEGRVAIVTGASRGIGREIALTLGRNGASVVVVYHAQQDKANEVVSLIQTHTTGSSKAIAVRADMSSEDDLKDMFDKAEQAFGCGVHILVNNAAIAPMSTIEDTSMEVWDSVFAVNTRGTFVACREATKRLARGGGGRIVNISSSVVAMALEGSSVYSASKAALDTFTKILAKELRGTRITANAVSPGAVATDMFLTGRDEATIEHVKAMNPFGRLGEPQDIALLVLFLVSDEGEWVNGQVIRANGGSTV